MEHIASSVTRRSDTRSGSPCEFCMKMDSEFPKRSPLDQMVAPNKKHIASAHLTEDGYVRHRMLELGRLRSRSAA